MTMNNKQTNKQSNSQILTPTEEAQLRALGFDDSIIETPRRLILSIGGREKTGKTTFGCSAPGPIFYFNVDIGAEGVVGELQSEGKQIFNYDVRVPRESANQDTWRPLWSDLKQRVKKVYSINKGSAVWDTATEMYELARLAHFGKLTQIMPHHYTEVNNEWREFLRTAYDAKGMNTIFLHKMKPKYINNARTNEYEVSGFGEMDYLSQVNLVTYRENVEGEAPLFSAYIKDIRTKNGAKHIGSTLEGPMCNFDFLLNLVHGPAKKNS